MLCLILCCGAASGAELFQSRPTATLSDNQVSIRNHLASEQGFKSITPIEINKAALNSSIIEPPARGVQHHPVDAEQLVQVGRDDRELLRRSAKDLGDSERRRRHFVEQRREIGAVR